MTTSTRSRIALSLLFLPVAAALVVTLFAAPNARLAPRDLPVGVVGTAAEQSRLEQRLAAASGTFEITRYANPESARRAIREREIYGALVADHGETAALTASAASPAVAQILSGLSSARPPTSSQDVVPGPERDPRASALAASILPLLIAGMFAGGVATRLAPLGLGRLGLAALAAVVAGAAAAAILDPWLGVIDGAWIDNWAALSLIIGAIAAVVVGLAAHLGRLGIALAGFAMVLVANVFSGIASAPELLPEPVGALGQLMPAGAGGNLLRSTAFFDGAAAADHALVLAAWTAAGIAALIVAVARTRLPLLLNPDVREPAGARARP